MGVKLINKSRIQVLELMKNLNLIGIIVNFGEQLDIIIIWNGFRAGNFYDCFFLLRVIGHGG